MPDSSSDAVADATNADSNTIIVNNNDVLMSNPPFDCLKQKRNKKLFLSSSSKNMIINCSNWMFVDYRELEHEGLCKDAMLQVPDLSIMGYWQAGRPT